MKAIIPKAVLPETISEPNALVSYYTTNVLYPKIGPLAINRQVKVIARLLRDYASSINLIDMTRDFEKKYKKPVQVIQQPKNWLKEEIKFEPILGNTNHYLKSFVVELSEFSAPINTISEVIDKKASLQFSEDRTEVKKMAYSRGLPIIVSKDVEGDSRIRALSDMKEGDLLAMKNRVIARPLSMDQLMRSDDLNIRMDGDEPVKMKTSDLNKMADTQERAYKLGNIMHGLSHLNAVMPEMIAANLINVKGDLLGASLKKADYLDNIIKALADRYEVDDHRLKAIAKLIDQAIAYLEALGLENDPLIKRYRENLEFQRKVQKFVIGKIDQAKPIDNERIPLPDEAEVTKSREWAFQRGEKLELFIKKPVLKGPFSAEAVSPNSELTITESQFESQFQSTTAVQSTAMNRSDEQAVFTSDRFKQELSNMTESGVMDEASFSSESTLLETLRERRRETINRTLANISSENENQLTQGYVRGRNSSRSYTTRGKDPEYATTELSFQVVTPVDVKVSLESINLVWAPQIPSPFISLHRIIRRQRWLAEREYIAQNYTIDPVRPIVEYEEQVITKELGINGRSRYQTGSFSFPLDSTFQTGGWELYLPGSKVDFRNGTGDDYNWNETWNWDDLENWDTYFKSLELEGNLINGVAVLETTDPETFNKGFFTFRFVVRRMTEASKAALRVYANDQAVTAAEKRAIESRARQYAKLKQEELIQKYTNRLNLREEAFDALIAQVFQGQEPEHFSYYKEILRTCIDWNASGMHFEANTTVGLPYPEYSRSHFMNCVGVRFILPILRSAEQNFIDTLLKNGNDYYKSSIETVQKLTNNYRDLLEGFRENAPDKLVLDRYSKEVVIGKHLEAIISNHPFTDRE
ncbi:hypothetical protein ACFFU9_14945 [Mariniflexile ostreae]|uniref:Uncharacterized protein n=1 Tax=Mariniflexile ostreae TaxID=1520892 RepID=A0ABV5FF37_9FLAO